MLLIFQRLEQTLVNDAQQLCPEDSLFLRRLAEEGLDFSP